MISLVHYRRLRAW